MKKKLIIITGPTASGKSGTAVKLAKKTDGEIISADSMQVYRHLNIGSAKITDSEMCGIKHHLIDILEPEEEFNVYRFKELAARACDEIYACGKLPIIAGGTGFYIQALLYDVDFEEKEGDGGYRAELDRLLKEKGAGYLYKMLRETDPGYADIVHENNVRRVMRALEYHHDTGELLSEHNRIQREKTSDYDFRYFVLNMPREELYKRIDERVDIMFEQGLCDEVRALKERGLNTGHTSMQGIGYRELLSYFDGEISLSDAKELIKKNSRHYAKRQLTWFRHEKDVIMINKEEFQYDDEKIIGFILGKL
ncbi:MAG: tRNA (adenosine(37)-N6)-dimethylallyltransferase MiaA [Lachnospiraceae bacterium]|nr:tRNA (adenosine(37)-N6)-dimethylallyltransferase MiaA [Lachnospiraceae bacterium]